MTNTESIECIGRVVTQNLLISAVEAERSNHPFDSSVEDLAALIDAAVLYDELFVLDRSGHFHHQGRQSDLIDLLGDEGVISSRPLDSAKIDKIAATARCHLGAYLGSDKVSRFDGLIRHALVPSETTYGLLSQSDNVEDVHVGNLSLRTIPDNVDPLQVLQEEEKVARGTTFLVRTFLYLAYSDVLATPFLVDHARKRVVEETLDRERLLFREQLATALGESFSDYPWTLSGSERPVSSPFAALVFARSGGKRGNLAVELQKLRNELAPARARLNNLERATWCGLRSEAIRAEREWAAALEEITTSFGPNPGLLDVRRLLSELR